MLGLWQGVSDLLPDAVALVISRGVGHIEVAGLAGQKPVSIGTSSVLDGHVLFVHGCEAVGLNAEVNLAQAVASLALLATLDSLKALGQLIGAVRRVIARCYLAAAISEVLLYCFDYGDFGGRVLDNWPSWCRPVHLKGIFRPIEGPSCFNANESLIV